MINRRLLVSGLACSGLVAGPAYAAISVPVFVGEIGESNLSRLCGRIADAQDKVIGLKVRIAPLSKPGLAAEFAENELYLFDGEIEIVGTGVAMWLHGAIQFDGFFIPKSGGMHQGTMSYGLHQVEEALVRLNPDVSLVEERFD